MRAHTRDERRRNRYRILHSAEWDESGKLTFHSPPASSRKKIGAGLRKNEPTATDTLDWRSKGATL